MVVSRPQNKSDVGRGSWATLGCLAAAVVGRWFGLMPDRTCRLHALLVHGYH